MPYRFVSALVGALPLSLALCAALAMLLPGGWRHAAIGAMVLIVPMWIGIASWVMAVSSRRGFFAWMAGGNAVAFALFFAAKLMSSAS